MCLGQEINANHLRAVSTGTVTATARPFHLGGAATSGTSRIRDESERLVCVSRLTMAVVERRPNTAAPPLRLSQCQTRIRR